MEENSSAEKMLNWPFLSELWQFICRPVLCHRCGQFTTWIPHQRFCSFLLLVTGGGFFLRERVPFGSWIAIGLG